MKPRPYFPYLPTDKPLRDRDISDMELGYSLTEALRRIKGLKEETNSLTTVYDLTVIEKLVRHARLEWKNHYCM